MISPSAIKINYTTIPFLDIPPAQNLIQPYISIFPNCTQSNPPSDSVQPNRLAGSAESRRIKKLQNLKVPGNRSPIGQPANRAV